MMKFYLNATNNKMTGVDSFLSEDKGCGFADGLCADTEYGRYNDLIVVDTDRRADVSSIDFIKHHRYCVQCTLYIVRKSGNPLEKQSGLPTRTSIRR